MVRIRKIHLRRLRFLTFLSVLFLLPFMAFSHDSAAKHYRDFIGIFGGYGDKAFEDLAKHTISNGIDSYKTPGAFPYEFAKAGLKTPANHRILGHGWTLNDSIPRETLKILSEANPGREKDIIRIWQHFAQNLKNEAIKATGLPKAQAHAFASILYDIHLLGDLEPDNTLVKYVLSHKEIIRNIEKNARTLFKNSPKYSELISNHLRQVLSNPKKLPPQILAQELMDELHRLRIGDMLHNALGDRLKIKYDINRVIKANEILKQRPLHRVPGADATKITSRQHPINRSDFNQTNNTKEILRAGLLTKDGRLIVAIREGATTGIMIFVTEGGSATYQYFHGDILRPEFEEKIIDAAIKGGTVGTGVGVAVMMGATPGGLIIYGVGTGIYMVTDLAISKWREHQAKKFLTIADLSAYGIRLDTMLALPIDSILTPKCNSILDLEKDSTLDLRTDSTLDL